MKAVIRASMYAFLVMAVVFTSCSTEDGEDGLNGTPGIQGETGMDGLDGENGQDGQDGQDGDDGNANVFSSGWEEFDLAVWSAVSSEFGVDFRNYPLVVPEITQDIVNDGVVLIYARFVITNTQIYTLPFTENITVADPAGQIVSYRFEVNDLTIKMRNVTGSGDPGTFGGPGIAEYRYIVIPSAGRSSQESPSSIFAELKKNGVDVNDYNSVAAYFNLN